MELCKYKPNLLLKTLFKKIKTGSVTFIQRFGGPLNLNVHFHNLYIDGVYSFEKRSLSEIKPGFFELTPPSDEEVEEVNHLIKKRTLKWPRKNGMVEDFEEGKSQLIFPEFNDILQEANANSIQRRKSLGKERGTKVDQIGKYWDPPWENFRGKRSSYLDGFSLHANVAVSKKNREGLEKLCRYVARGPIAESRLNLDESEDVIYELKKPYRDGTTHLKFSPLEFLSKAMSLIPPPRSHLVRYHGVLAQNSKHRSKIVSKTRPKKEGINNHWILWADLLKRIFKEEAIECPICNQDMKIVSLILEPLDAQSLLTSMEEEQIISTSQERGPPSLEKPLLQLP